MMVQSLEKLMMSLLVQVTVVKDEVGGRENALRWWELTCAISVWCESVGKRLKMSSALVASARTNCCDDLLTAVSTPPWLSCWGRLTARVWCLCGSGSRLSCRYLTLGKVEFAALGGT